VLCADDRRCQSFEDARIHQAEFSLSHAKRNQGTAAYINDDTKSFMDRYSDMMYLGDILGRRLISRVPQQVLPPHRDLVAHEAVPSSRSLELWFCHGEVDNPPGTIHAGGGDGKSSNRA
jgi:hypothetical protein